MKRTYLLIVLLYLLIPHLTNAQKPNIVWISIEDTSPDFIGCYGNPQVKTPNIDGLAKEGVKFTNAFSTNTVCAPSRHSIITGLLTSEDGCGNHRSTMKIPSYVKGFAYYLKQNGYYTTNNSKTDYNLGNVADFIKQNWSVQGNTADFGAREHKEQPFFSVYNIMLSHQSMTTVFSNSVYNDQLKKSLKPEEVIQPAGLIIPPVYINNDDNRRNMARLYNSMLMTDKKVGEIINHIKESGEWENTIVFFFGDHGQGMPRFKTNASRLGTQIPFVIRVPSKYKNLLKNAPGSNFDELVTFEDFAPTMIAIATGKKAPTYMKGRVFMGKNKQKEPQAIFCSRDVTDEVIDMGRVIVKDDYIYTRIYYPNKPVLQQQNYANRSEMVQQMHKDFDAGLMNKFQAEIFSPRQAEYLFNRKTDKWEMHNLAYDKKYATILKDMQQILHQKQLACNDIGFLPPAVLGQIDQMDTILNWKQKNYKADKYLKVAEMVGRGATFLNTQLALMHNADSVVRYWAAIGLRNQKTIELDEDTLLRLFNAEKSDLVKIELADILYVKFNSEQALFWLPQRIESTDNLYFAWQAAAKLENYRDMPRALLKKMEILYQTVPIKFKGSTYAFRAAMGTLLHKDVGE